MRGFFVLAPVLLLAGFSPPASLPPQGVQEGPPKSWIPEKAPKPPIAVTPDRPRQPPSPRSTGNAPDAARPPLVDQQVCATRDRAGGAVSEKFAAAYNAAKQSLLAGHVDDAYLLSLEAQEAADADNQRAAILAMQILIAAEVRDEVLLEQVIARRIEIGCVTAAEQRLIDNARNQFKAEK